MTRKRSSQRLEEYELAHDPETNPDTEDKFVDSSEGDDVLKFNERVKSVISFFNNN